MSEAKKVWSKDETSQLIGLYESRPELWDTKSAHYKDRGKKNSSVLEMAEKLNTTSAEIQRKIHNLRNQVSQEMHKMKKKLEIGSDDSFVSSWPFFESLKFIMPTLSTRTSFSNLVVSVTEETDETENTDVSSVSGKPGGSVRQGAKRRIDDESDDSRHSLLNLMARLPDDYDTFGEYVAMELRSLRTDSNRRRLKSEIRKSICRIADEDDLSVYSSPSPRPD